ncbi:hypothetical protein LSUB1_G000525 [Lachnellula subtilissima]|uniref:Transglycosylase SLT domain-containing protein n=1 Tax=Lachnellula subtilissima TaxID=602034 RepID=A0A8H8RYB3_9HELO|nr:hypothetical protein LSUB1_G000525 [Lachnellula subtilissima]
MSFKAAAVILLSLASTSLAAPFSNGTSTTSSTTASGTGASLAATGKPTTFTGDGTPGAGWPTEDKWATYSAILAANQKVLSSSCTQFNKTNNTPGEIKDIDTSIQSVANTTGVDPRFILAVVMQESKGCVRVHDTLSPPPAQIRNPGLMQDHNGTNSCANTTVPCPPATITGMIMDGTNGTVGLVGGGDGIKQTLAQAITEGGKDAQATYIAARIYNSGSYTFGTDLGGGQAATASYASDIANRLLGLSF